jgi:hypothetical protein
MLHQRFCAACTERGAYFTSHHNWFMSVAHTDEDLARTLEIVDDAFAALARAQAPGERDDGALASVAPDAVPAPAADAAPASDAASTAAEATEEVR